MRGRNGGQRLVADPARLTIGDVLRKLEGDVDALKAAMPNLSVATFHEHVDADAADVIDGRMDVARLPAWPREEADVWLCGPLKFMQAQWLALLNAGVPAARLHREVFGPELLDHLL